MSDFKVVSVLNPTVVLTAGPAISAGTSSQNTGTVSFANSNGVTFGLSNGTLTASAAGGGGGGGIAASAGTQSMSTGTLVLANSNGVTFGMSGSSQITASYTVPSTAGLLSNINVSAGTTSNNLSAVTFSNSNGVSFGLNGSTVTGSVAAQTNQSVGIYASSQTYGQSSSSTIDARSLSVVGSGGVSVGMSAGALLISGQTTAAQTNQSAIKAFGVSNTGQTAGNTGVSTGIDWVLAGSGSITLSQSTVGGGPNTVWVQHPAWITTQTAVAFSADASSTFQTLTFQNSNGVSFSNNAGALRVTHDLQYTSATSAITSNALNTSASRVINIIAATNSTGGGTASLSSNVSFSAANGITFYTSAGNAIVGSHNALTTARASTDAIGLNTAQTNVTWTANSSGLSINAAGYAGTTTAVTGNAVLTLNSLGLRLDGSGLAGTSTGFTGANISASMTQNSAGLALSMSVAAPGGGGGVALSAGTQSVSTGTVKFADSNGITFGMSGSSQVTASYNSTQFAGTGTSITGLASITLDSAGIKFNGSNLAGTGTTFAGANISGSMTMNSAGANLSLSVAPPGAAAEQNAVNLLGANTAGNTTATGSTLGFSGLNLTLSGTNASQIVFSAPATSSIVGISGVSLSTNGSTVSIMPAAASYFAWPFNVMASTQTITVASNTSVVFPIELHDLENFDFVMLPGTVSIASMASIATAANNTKSYTQAGTFNFVLYSRGVGASSQSLQSVASTSHSSQMTIAIGQNANGSQWTVTHAFSFPATNTAQATFSTSYATTLSNVNVSTTHLTAISGAKKLGFPWATSLSNGQYWLMTGLDTAATTNGTASLSNMRVTQSMLGMTQVNLTWGEFGSANNASIQALYGVGSYTKAAVGTTGSIGLSNISSSASHVVPYITFARIA